jgi:argininosuccinate lyase
MLAAQGILSPDDFASHPKGLERSALQIEAGEFTWQESLEDVHMNVEAPPHALIGEAGRRLHTARSRNDQVATDLRLWLRAASMKARCRARSPAGAPCSRWRPSATVRPSCRATPTCSAPSPSCWPTTCWRTSRCSSRDRGRAAAMPQARRRVAPGRSAALAGTPFPIDRASLDGPGLFAGPMATASTRWPIATSPSSSPRRALAWSTCRGWARSSCCGRARSSPS